jgi:hypothetical protein
MIKKPIACTTFLLIFMCITAYAWARDENKYFPTPVPVNIAPGSYDDSRWGVGYNIINVTSDWEDNFFTFESEHIGNIEYRIEHLVVAFLKSKRESSSIEYDVLIGKIKTKAGKDQYYSELIGQDVNVDHSGDGIDVGIRLIYSRNIFRQLKEGQKRLIDWNYAFSLHAAYFYTEGTYKARSTDDQFASGYHGEEEGIFLRPVLSLQPVINLTDRFSLIPYVGIGTKISIWYAYWEDTGDYIFNGYNSPSQKSDGEESGIDSSVFETYLGFDVGIKTISSSNHQLTIGGVFTQLFGENDSDFAEVHVIYSLPF